MQGKIKWNVKNHVRVALSLYLLRTHLRVILLGLFRCKGWMADRRFVIIVAPPNDMSSWEYIAYECYVLLLLLRQIEVQFLCFMFQLYCKSRNRLLILRGGNGR